MLTAYPFVTLDEIGHALAYYRAHPDEIEAEFERQDRAFEEMERKCAGVHGAAWGKAS